MGPKPRICSLEDQRKVLELSEEGYSQQEIAVRIGPGCIKRSVCNILKKKKRITGTKKNRTTREFEKASLIAIRLLQR